MIITINARRGTVRLYRGAPVLFTARNLSRFEVSPIKLSCLSVSSRSPVPISQTFANESEIRDRPLGVIESRFCAHVIVHRGLWSRLRGKRGFVFRDKRGRRQRRRLLEKRIASKRGISMLIPLYRERLQQRLDGERDGM